MEETAKVVCPTVTDPLDPVSLLDDFEDQNAALNQVGGRSGDWWISTDDTADGSITPAAGAATPERIPGERCGSRYGLHVSGSGFNEWGAVLSVSLNWQDENLPIDLSAYRGVRFWARAGKENAATIRVGFHDTVSHPNGGICDPTVMVYGFACWDSFGTDVVPLNGEWKQYEIHFDRLSQRDFGVPGEALDTQNLFIAEWLIGPREKFDFWLDDVSLFD